MKYRFVTPWISLLIVMTVLSCTTLTGLQEFRDGKEYSKQLNYGEAVKKYSEAIKKNPDYWEFYVYRGAAYGNLNQIDLAIHDLSYGLELIPMIDTWYGELPRDEWASIYLRRGILYHENNFYDQAIQDYKEAIDLNPQCVDAYFYRAVIKEKMNKLSDAVEDYSKIIDFMSKSASGISDSVKVKVFLNRANLYRGQNKLDLALADNNQAVEMDGGWYAFFSRGTTYCKIGNFKRAITDFDMSVEIQPSINAYLYRASARLVTTCDLKKILEDYYSILDIVLIDSGTRHLVYNQIAWILATATDGGIRDSEKALEYAQKAVEIKADCRSLDTLAVTFAGNGHFDEAINIHKRALELCKMDNPELLSEIEKHMENYKIKKALREKCPGAEIERNQLYKWRSE